MKFNAKIMIVMLLIVLVLPFMTKTSVSKAATTRNVTFFIHGYKGGEGTYETMIARYTKKGWGKKTASCVVDKKINVKCDNLKSSNENQFVQVIFKANTASIADQTLGLTRIMREYALRYSLQNVNIVAHSMGGLVSSKYIQNTSKLPSYPKVSKIVTLGTPYLGSALANEGGENPAKKDLKYGSVALNELYKNRGKFYKNTSVFAIAGTNDVKTDGVVDLESATTPSFVNSVSKKQTKSFKNVNHSGLHENTTIDQVIAKYLWNK